MKEISVVSPKGQFANVTLEDDKVDAYIARHSAMGTWGRPEHWTTEEVKDAETRVNDETGETEYKVPAEFTVTITDLTEQIAEREQKETERKTKEQAEIARLKSARAVTLQDLIERVDALTKLVLAGRGEIDLAEDAGSKEKERP